MSRTMSASWRHPSTWRNNLTSSYLLTRRSLPPPFPIISTHVSLLNIKEKTSSCTIIATCQRSICSELMHHSRTQTACVISWLRPPANLSASIFQTWRLSVLLGFQKQLLMPFNEEDEAFGFSLVTRMLTQPYLWFFTNLGCTISA